MSSGSSDVIGVALRDIFRTKIDDGQLCLSSSCFYMHSTILDGLIQTLVPICNKILINVYELQNNVIFHFFVGAGEATHLVTLRLQSDPMN